MSWKNLKATHRGRRARARLLAGLGLVLMAQSLPAERAFKEEVVPIMAIGEFPALIDTQLWLDFGAQPFRKPEEVVRKQDDGLRERAAVSERMRRLLQLSGYRRYLNLSVEDLQRLTQEFPDDVDAATVQGVRLYQAGDTTASIEAFAKARQADPDHLRSAELFLGLLVVGGELERAAQEGRAILERFPENTTIRFNLACALARNKQTEEALYHLVVLARLAWPELIYHLNDTDLANLQNLPAFQDLEKTLHADLQARVIESLRP